jgi:hypothetical protein
MVTHFNYTIKTYAFQAFFEIFTLSEATDMSNSPTPLFRGSATALITPFLGGKIDFDCFENLVDSNIRGGADALVMGTALLKAEDPAAVVKACKALGD